MDKTLCILLPSREGILGGAELLAEDLCSELKKNGVSAELRHFPFRTDTKEALIKSIIDFQALDLSDYYGIIATKFPSYLVSHPNIYLYLIHQHRELYEFFGTRFSSFSHNSMDDQLRGMIYQMEKQRLSELDFVKTISRTVSSRLERYFGISTQHIYVPPPGKTSYKEGVYEDYILFVSRLEEDKRPHLFIEALSFLPHGIKGIMVGSGSLSESLKIMIEKKGLSERVSIKSRAGFDELCGLYSNCLCVVFCPFDEDYGFVTHEAFLSRKPVITVNDSGGVLEFVENGVNGYICREDPEEMASSIMLICNDREKAGKLGRKGYEKVSGLSYKELTDDILLSLGI